MKADVAGGIFLKHGLISFAFVDLLAEAHFTFIISGRVRKNYIPYIRHIVWYVELGSRIKIFLGPLDRRFYSLVTSSQSPPFSVILARFDFSVKHAPSPLVN